LAGVSVVVAGQDGAYVVVAVKFVFHAVDGAATVVQVLFIASRDGR